MRSERYTLSLHDALPICASAVADVTSPTGFTIQLVNQGDVDLSGFEVETMFAVTDRFTLEGSTGTADYEMSDRKSTRLNSSHLGISYAVFCLKKKHDPDF